MLIVALMVAGVYRYHVRIYRSSVTICAQVMEHVFCK